MLSACWGTPPMQRALHGSATDMADGRAAFRRGDYSSAVVLFRRAQFDLNPADEEMAELRYYIAECDLQLGEGISAGLEFHKVADEYPNTRYAPLALLRAGDANLRLWRRPELDPTGGQTALAAYQELVGRYPNTDAASRAQLRIRQLNEWFAEKDYKNGLFYFRRKAFDSAIIYFKDIIATYPGTPLVPEALLRLVDSYHAIGYAEELKEACANLRRFYPQTDGLERRCPADVSAGAQ
jgi:outer membrane protein assembly factor BamD